jgi:hypothetical protein
VAWSSQNQIAGSGWNIFMQRYDSAGARKREEFQPRLERQPVGSVVKAGVVSGLVASAGYLLLSARAGDWLLTVLLARPLVWKGFDPIDVLFAWEKEKKRRRARGNADADGPEDESLQ